MTKNLEKKVRVLHYIPSFSKGGIEKTFEEHAINMTENFENCLLVEDGSDLEILDEIRGIGCKIFIIKRLTSNPIKYIMELRKLFEDNYFDIVVTFNVLRSFPFLYIAKNKGIKVRVLQATTTVLTDNKDKEKLFSSIYKINIKLATDLVAVSSVAGESLFKNNDFKIMPNAIDTGKFKFDIMKRNMARQKNSIENEKINLGHVGRLTNAKNQIFLINLLSVLPEDYILTIVGDGPEFTALHSKAIELSVLHRVYFERENSEVTGFYSSFDIFLLPSNYEGFGNVMIESQAAGLPTIASKNVPIDTKQSNLCWFVDLNVIEWAKVIIETEIIPYEHRSIQNEVMDSSIFNIKNAVQSYESLYMELVNE